MTGEIEKGRSISVSSRLRPTKLYFVTAQLAATPKTMLNGTAIAATNSVRRTAASVSGSVKAARNTSQPLRRPSMKTTTSGSNSTAVRNAMAAAMRT